MELSEVLFGEQEGGRLYLTLSEVIGNLEVLEEAGGSGRRRMGR